MDEHNTHNELGCIEGIQLDLPQCHIFRRCGHPGALLIISHKTCPPPFRNLRHTNFIVHNILNFLKRYANISHHCVTNTINTLPSARRPNLWSSLKRYISILNFAVTCSTVDKIAATSPNVGTMSVWMPSRFHAGT